MDSDILKKALAFHRISEEHLIQPLSGGTYNAVYEFRKQKKHFVIRIGKIECDIDTTDGMIEWMQYLDFKNAAVPRLVKSRHGNPVEYIPTPDGVYSVDVTEKIEGTLARVLVRENMDISWAKTFGQAVGKMHRLGSTNPPENMLKVRPHWNQIHNDFNSPRKLTEDEALLCRKHADILTRIHYLPKTPDTYGLVHVDLHLDNIMVSTQVASITMLDFDDVCYGWFVMDLVSPITDIVVCHPGTNKDDIINTYLTEAIAGYQLEHEISSHARGTIPLFLSLLEIEFYARFHTMKTLQHKNWWVNTFMDGRKQRIIEGIPFVNIL
ncbi:phosphotransferase enzyme family protein [Candidatus Riflebacteria bacterium]